MTPRPRSYTAAQVRELLAHMPRSTFFTLKAAGQLTFLEELRPRLGRSARYRADLVDRYLENDWQRQPQRTFPRAVGARS